MSKNRSKYLVEMKGISKSFKEVQALKNVDFRVGHREVVALVGDNGAGKSTLIKIMIGLYRPDKGEIYFDGKMVKFRSPADSRKLGCEVVQQTGALIDEMNTAENFFLGNPITKKIGFIKILDKKKMKEVSKKYLKEIGIHLRSLDQKVKTLSGGERQAVSIGRCMNFGSKLLLLDEPTAALSIGETEKVLKYIKGAKKQGFSIVIVSHIIRHIYPVADRFVILDKGKKLGGFKKDETSRKQIEEMIVRGRLS